VWPASALMNSTDGSVSARAQRGIASLVMVCPPPNASQSTDWREDERALGRR
jgi:hypothetical protein